MDRRPIGVFDSGLGGLTALRKLMAFLPHEDIIYLGDTGRLPYGSRSRGTIIKYARQDIAFLQKFDIKTVVVACGTVSTNALDEISGDYAVPVFGVVEAAVKKAAEVTKNKKIGLVGTAASIKSGTYDRYIRRFSPEAKVYGRACPLFVPLIENGRTEPGDIVIETVTEEYLTPLREKGIDTLILGCTHYPLLHRIISRTMGDGVTLISPGEETAKAVSKYLDEHALLSDYPGAGRHRFFVTDSTEDFAHMASVFLESSVFGEVEQVSLDAF